MFYVSSGLAYWSSAWLPSVVLSDLDSYVILARALGWRLGILGILISFV